MEKKTVQNLCTKADLLKFLLHHHFTTVKLLYRDNNQHTGTPLTSQPFVHSEF